MRNRSRLWRRILGRYIRLRIAGKRVQIISFATDSHLYAEGAPGTFHWEVAHAWRMRIDPLVGTILPEAKVSFTAQPGMRQFRLTAYGPGGPVTADVEIQVKSATIGNLSLKPTSQATISGKESMLKPLMRLRTAQFLKGNVQFRYLNTEDNSTMSEGSFWESTPAFHDIQNELSAIRQAGNLTDLELIQSRIHQDISIDSNSKT